MASKRELVMLAKTYAPKRIKAWHSGIHIEPKLDGIRVYATVANRDSPIYYSRNGRSLEMLSHLNSELMKLAARLHKMNKGYHDGAFFDGELISATGNFEDISGVIHRKEATTECLAARYHLFHAMPLEHFKKGADEMPQEYRIQCLQEALTYHPYQLITVSEPLEVDSHKQVMRRYVNYRSKGHEGAMVKDLSLPWVAKRSYAWMKIKPEDTADVKVVDFKPGKGKYEGTLGALICKYKGKKIRVSGMTDEQRDEFFKNFKALKGKMIEVSYQNVTNRGSLRHPRFKRLRPDKEKK